VPICPQYAVHSSSMSRSAGNNVQPGIFFGIEVNTPYSRLSTPNPQSSEFSRMGVESI
jgi:hypothetical protein